MIPADGLVNSQNQFNFGFDTLPEDQTTKNTLIVGTIDINNNITSFSSQGPTDDGRIKPDVCALGFQVFTSFSTSPNGYSSEDGTSFSAPIVTGSINLLRELRSNAEMPDMKASTIRGLVIHTAEDIGRPGPDYTTGWGRMNAQAAAELIDADSQVDSLPHIKEIFFSDGETCLLYTSPSPRD